MSNSAYIHRQTQADPGRLDPSHSPRHLRATAHLYGLSSAPLPTARVLFVGCGSAEGILPFASAYPGARIIGIEASPAHVDQGLEVVRRLKLDNVQLLCQDYESLDENLGEFDYIIVTGLYSRLQADAAQSLLAYCGRHLSPLGLLYVDYHVYPGAKAQEIVRDALLLHAHAAQTEAEVKASAKAALALFDDGLAGINPMGQALGIMARRIGGQLDSPDDTGGPTALSSSACYFIEFAERAAHADLSYAGDSQPLSEIALNFGQGVSLSNSLLTLGQPTTLKQQYLDFATCRGFRQSLLVSTSRSDEVERSPDLKRMQDLRWASGLHRLAGHQESDDATYVNHRGQGITIPDEATQTVVNALAHAWPGSLPYTTLLAVLMKRAGLDDAAGRSTLDGSLKLLLNHSVVHYSLDESPYDATADQVNRILGCVDFLPDPETPGISGFNLWHEPVHLHLSGEQKQLARGIAAGQSLASLANQAFTGKQVDGLQNGTSEIAALLHLLRRYALTSGSSDTWITLLRNGLDESAGNAPYIGLYVGALARRSLESRILGSDSNNATLAPALLNQANRMQELARQNDLRQAESLARHITQLAPAYIDAWEILTASQFNGNRLEEALQSALRMLQHAPADYRSFMLLCVALSRLQRTSEAITAGRRAIELEPRNAEAHSALGDALNSEHRYYEARRAYETALTYDPGHRKSRVNLCKVLIDAGNIEAAEIAAREAVDAFPTSPAGYDNLLFAANYSPDKTAAEVFASYQECDRQLYLPLRNKWRPHTNSRDANRKLKVGYVSPDFRQHAANRFVEPLLEHADRKRFELYAYAELTNEDDVTRRLKPYFDHWVPTAKLDDSKLAERIRADGIDVLIDIAGHTKGNRLGAFARKPAPVSATWLGYVYTTGLSAIDYIATDAIMAPAGTEDFFSERPWHLRSNLVYRPHQGMGDVSELPALENGYVTFVTLTRAIRINHRTIRVWSEILRRLPSARLVVDSSSYIDQRMRASLKARFAAAGIPAHRLHVDFRTPPWNVLRATDIALDCFPHNSGTTLVESLYMGIPYVTLAGRPGVGRIGSSLLAAAGCEDWIAHSEDEYIEKVIALASDLPRLAEIRRGLRQQVQESALMDEVGFTRDFETAIQRMFKNWCENEK
ncbi:methyltransferase domain-containing protein [Achromobacter arsenitoxydans]|uniref:O-linked N-acetylglucosamine transferase family protein n=1 Tax=Achromobacter arsenitoxydans TaxID=1147684 RepID=UPI0005B8B1EA|nr:methyltransferase domain-containing protein [Achromobacter arsenitoxydans]